MCKFIAGDLNIMFFFHNYTNNFTECGKNTTYIYYNDAGKCCIRKLYDAFDSIQFPGPFHFNDISDAAVLFFQTIQKIKPDLIRPVEKRFRIIHVRYVAIQRKVLHVVNSL